jgi:ATP-dependent Clp protease adaptor protein ClpS
MVPLVVVPLLAGVVAGSAWYALRSRKRVRRLSARNQVFDACDADAQAALEVAFREAQTRGRAVSAVDLLWGLLQVEEFTRPIVELGGLQDEIENRVLEALDGPPSELAGVTKVFAHALVHARFMGYKSTCATLWLRVAQTSAGRLVEVGTLTADALSFRLVHGVREPSAKVTTPETLVVLRNDDYTTVEFVVLMLREVFGLTLPEAQQLAKDVGDHSRGVVGRFRGAEATAKVEAARALARRDGHPLWIGVEPA